MQSIHDSNLVKLVREGERRLEQVRHNAVAKRTLGIALLAFAALLFIPPWFLIPGLVFTGFSLLGWQPFRFGCGASKRRASQDELT